MKKFIKINFIILVIFFLVSGYIVIFPQMVLADEEEQNTIEESVSESNDEEENLNEESNEEIEEEPEEEKTMDDLELEKSQIESNIEISNSHIEFLESELSATVAEISSYNQQILDMELKAEELKVQEKELLVYINQAEKDIKRSNARYKKQKDLLETRMVAMYENGGFNYLDLLLSSKNLTDFFSNYYLITEITEADDELLEDVAAEKAYNKKLKATLDKKKSELVSSREQQEKMSILLENMIVIKNNKVNALNEEERNIQQQIEDYQNQINEIEKEIRELALKNIGAQYVGGEMAWPVPGYTRITSPFGMRTHPITGVYKLHTGTDISAPYGALFVAANDGVVTYAGENRAYGRMVIVDHGGGITTLYAHGSEILVEVGQIVHKGEGVLKVGSTGYSTGPHAHFEVRINGNYVEPLGYITSYSSNTDETKKIIQNDNTNDKNSNTVYFDLRTNE